MSAPSTEQIAARWDLASRTYDEWDDLQHPHPDAKRAWADTLTELLGVHPRRDGSPALRVADVGTGTAQIALLLAEIGHDVTGYDIAPAMLERARAKAAQAGLAVTFAPGDAYALPLDDGSVDVVVNRMVFWTLCDPPAALLEWRRVLAPGGRIVVIDGLWRASPSGVTQKTRHACQRAFWAYKQRVRQRGGPRVGTYDTDTVAPAGWGWQTAADAQAHFAEASLHGSQLRWLHELFEVQRRTTPAWRWLVYSPKYFALTWSRASVS